jgi:hypothetical protein
MQPTVSVRNANIIPTEICAKIFEIMHQKKWNYAHQFSINIRLVADANRTWSQLTVIAWHENITVIQKLYYVRKSVSANYAGQKKINAAQ